MAPFDGQLDIRTPIPLGPSGDTGDQQVEYQDEALEDALAALAQRFDEALSGLLATLDAASRSSDTAPPNGGGFDEIG